MNASTYREGLTPRLPDGRPYPGREGSYHPSAGLVAAANAALVLGMPLLLTGEPGCGKTDFASAVAGVLGWPCHTCFVRSDSRARDLLYSYDALRRFGDAQYGSAREKQRARDSRHYIRLEGLGLGLTSPEPAVVLIDEIDKAPRDLPNDLLRELDRSRAEFEIPELDDAVLRELDAEYRKENVGSPMCEGRALKHVMRRPTDAPRPLVIITSNIERQLPEPFLRRCLFFHIEFPDAMALKRIVQGRFPRQPEPLLTQAIDLVLALRKHYGLTKKPTTAELISWLEVLERMCEPAYVQHALAGAASKLDREKHTPLKPIDWSLLPGLPCLLKLDEDLQRVSPKKA
jgi:MoxR-like ATPase